MRSYFILALFFFLVKAEAQDISINLQACYAFDCDNAINYANTGGALNGTLHSVSCAAGRNNIANTAYEFQGDTSSYIELPSDYRIKGDTICVSGWYYIDTYNDEQFIIFTKNNCGNYNYEAYNLNTYYDNVKGHDIFRICKASSSACSYAWIHSNTTPTAGNWYHIVFFMSNTKMWLYVNNVQEGSITHSVAFDYVPGKTVLLGVTRETANNRPFHGRIDDLRFYNRELTAAEVNMLYTQGKGCSGDVTGVEAYQESNDVKIYPNPSDGKIHIKHESSVIVKIFDITGEEIQNLYIPQNNKAGEFDVKTNTNGLYFVRIFSIDGQLLKSSKLVLKQ